MIYRHTVFKSKLVQYFKRKNEEREARERYMSETYTKLSAVWNKKVERMENSKKRKEKEAKARELYEKIFPELKKQREDKERDHRLGSRGAVRSEADMEDVIERLQEREVRRKERRVRFPGLAYLFSLEFFRSFVFARCIISAKTKIGSVPI